LIERLFQKKKKSVSKGKQTLKHFIVEAWKYF
jgi:hypothetical protein